MAPALVSNNGQEGLLKALNEQARIQWARETGLRQGLIWLTVSILVTLCWYTDIEKASISRSCIHWFVRYLFDIRGPDPRATYFVDKLLEGSRLVLRGIALVLFAVGILELLGAAWTTFFDTPAPILEELGDEQRRLLGLESLSKKPFALPNVRNVDKIYQTPTSSAQPPLQTPDVIRAPYSDLAAVGPYISPPGTYLRDRITPGSSGSRRRPPYGPHRSANLSFGGSADAKMHELLEEYKQELQNPTATPEPQGYQMATISPSMGLIGPYKESPIAPSSGMLGVGKIGSPSERWDAAEWNRTLLRLGLDSYTMSSYVDNLREALYSEIISLLGRFATVVDALDRYGVSRDLMLDRKPASHMGYSLEDQLLHAQNLDPSRVKEYTVLKRVFREGYNWKDMFNYVITRFEDLTEDSYLSRYDWSRGGAIRDKNVSMELPTDADILMHIFLWMCDSLSEHRLSEGDQPFIKQHFLQVLPGEESRSLRGRNLIMRHGTSPPHFSVVENGHMYRIPRGKDNCFIAIVIFLYLARRDKWLPTYNQGYRRLLEAVFGSAFHTMPISGSGTTTSPLVSSNGSGGRGMSGGGSGSRGR